MFLDLNNFNVTNKFQYNRCGHGMDVGIIMQKHQTYRCESTETVDRSFKANHEDIIELGIRHLFLNPQN